MGFPVRPVVLLLRSGVFRIEHASAVLVEKDFRTQARPMQIDAICRDNTIRDLRFMNAVDHLLWLGNVHVQHLGNGQRWFVRRLLLPLDIGIRPADLDGGNIEVELPYRDVFELKTLDAERAVQAHREVSWYSGELTSYARTDGDGLMILLENPTSSKLEMPPGDIFEIRRLI